MSSASCRVTGVQRKDGTSELESVNLRAGFIDRLNNGGDRFVEWRGDTKQAHILVCSGDFSEQQYIDLDIDFKQLFVTKSVGVWKSTKDATFGYLAPWVEVVHNPHVRVAPNKKLIPRVYYTLQLAGLLPQFAAVAQDIVSAPEERQQSAWRLIQRVWGDNTSLTQNFFGRPTTRAGPASEPWTLREMSRTEVPDLFVNTLKKYALGSEELLERIKPRSGP